MTCWYPTNYSIFQKHETAKRPLAMKRADSSSFTIVSEIGSTITFAVHCASWIRSFVALLNFSLLQSRFGENPRPLEHSQCLSLTFPFADVFISWTPSMYLNRRHNSSSHNSTVLRMIKFQHCTTINVQYLLVTLRVLSLLTSKSCWNKNTVQRFPFH